MNLKEVIETGFLEPGPARIETVVTPAFSWKLEDGRDYGEPVAIQIPIQDFSVKVEGIDPVEAAGVNAEEVGPFKAGTLRVAFVLPDGVVISYRSIPWNHVFAHGVFQRITNGEGHPLYPEIDFAALGPDEEPPAEPEDPDAGDEAPADPEGTPAA